MARPRGTQSKTRLSISLDARSYATLERLATEHDVSLARIARQAILEFIERQADDQAELPLLRREAPNSRRPG
jgi:predicted transcriptional regulator